MSEKSVQAVMAESKALIAEHESLSARLDQLVQEANALAARAAGQDPAHFEIERYLRETLSAAEFAQLSAEARGQWARLSAEHGVSVPPTVNESLPAARAPGARPPRRMV